jgi:hypothetical protein
MSTNSNVRFRRNRAIVAISGIAAILSLPLTTSAHDAPEFTGVVIDVRAIAAIDRSPAPVIYGPLPTSDEVYPDPTCVPTPDQVQDQSVVRYYHTEEDAEKGAAGDHPIILKAEAVVGPAHDSVRLSADDAAHLKTLDKTMHYTHTWKVAFLIPENR